MSPLPFPSFFVNVTSAWPAANAGYIFVAASILRFLPSYQYFLCRCEDTCSKHRFGPARSHSKQCLVSCPVIASTLEGWCLIFIISLLVVRCRECVVCLPIEEHNLVAAVWAEIRTLISDGLQTYRLSVLTPPQDTCSNGL